jgi:hypothetical protein
MFVRGVLVPTCWTRNALESVCVVANVAEAAHTVHLSRLPRDRREVGREAVHAVSFQEGSFLIDGIHVLARLASIAISGFISLCVVARLADVAARPVGLCGGVRISIGLLVSYGTDVAICSVSFTFIAASHPLTIATAIAIPTPRISHILAFWANRTVLRGINVLGMATVVLVAPRYAGDAIVGILLSVQSLIHPIPGIAILAIAQTYARSIPSWDAVDTVVLCAGSVGC